MIDDNSRKRRRQDTYFPPRKRARIELVEHNDINNDDDLINCNKNKKDERVNHVQQNKKKIVPIITTNFTTLKRRRRSSSSECKRSTNNKQSNKRYRRRPLIRLLTVNKSKSPIVGASSSFREVIAQGKVTHILKECHSRAFDSNHGDNDTSSSTKDSLYGNGGENIVNAACIFGNETFKSSPLLMPKELVDTPRDVIGKSSSVVSSPTSVAAIGHLEEKQMPNVDDDEVEENDGLYYMLRGNTSHFTNDDDNSSDSTSNDSFASCQDVEPHDNEDVTHTVTPRDDDTTNTAARDELDRQIDCDTTTTTNTSPTNLSVASTQTEYSELTSSPDDQDDTNSPYSLPFHFMSPEEKSSTSTPRCNISFSFAGQGYSPQRGLDSPCILDNNEYSPIKPRPSKRPIMSPFPSSISLLPPSPPSEDEDEDTSIQYDLSPPFNFMSEDYMTQQSDFSDDYEYTPRASLSSLIKYILRFVIEWLLRVLIGKVPSNNDDNINNINPPTPPKPRDSISSSRLVPAAVTSQPSLCRRERQVKSSRTSISRPSSNVNVSAVDHQNEQTPASPDKCTKTAQHHVKKIPTTKPPSGWKNLFKPKEGEWKCKSCFYINPSEAMTCDSCTAIKDRPPGQVLKSCLRDKSTNVVGSSVSNNDTGKTPFKARKEKRVFDDSSIGDEENEESDSYSSYESDSEEEGSETYSEDADEEESYRGAPEWTGENDEEETDDEEADEEEESSPNKRVKRVVTSPLQAPPPAAPAPPQTIRKPTRSSYELVDDPSHSNTASTTFTSSKRVKRDSTPQDLTSSSASSIAATQPGIVKRNLSDTMSEDIPATSNKMARETSGESMDDVSVIYSEMDTEQRLPGLIQRKSSDNMSELSH